MKVIIDKDINDLPTYELEEIFKIILTQLEVNKEYVRTINIALSENYGRAIASINPTETFTDNENYKGMGKTIIHNDGSSSVVLNANIVYGFISLLKTGQLNKTTGLCRYLICHEFGHCLDNHQRKKIDSVIFPKIFNIDSVNLYYLDIMKSEYFACKYSSSAMTEELLIDDVADFNLAFDRFINGKYEHKKLFAKDSAYLGTMAFSISGEIWFLMIQFAKIVGSLNNKNIFTNCSVEDLVEKDQSFKELFRLIQVCLDKYEEIDSDKNLIIDGEIKGIWRKIAFMSGFKFEVVSEMSALYFNVED
jgi:hypothetical protein